MDSPEDGGPAGESVCPDCGAERRRLVIPESLREHAPDGEPAAASEERADADEERATTSEASAAASEPAVVVCTRCLRTWPPAAAPEAPLLEDPRALSGALPADREAAVAIVLAASLLDSVASNRATLEALFEAVEAAGADPRLAVERLADDPDLNPATDLRRRVRQFEGLR